MNILLFVVDALRPDHLGFNGYSRDTSPNIDKLAKEGFFFENVYCTLPRTDPTLASIFTGLHPNNHGIRLVYNNTFKENILTLPEILHSHGYKTAFMDADALHEPAVAKGFEEFNLLRWKVKNKIARGIRKIVKSPNFYGPTQQYADIAVKWLNKNSGKKFFLCYHPIDLHWPYYTPVPFDHMYDPDYKGNHDFNTLANGKLSRGDVIFGNVHLPEEEIKHAIAHYDGSIKYIDAQIGKILQCLKDNGIEENTLVILTADHGENFGEHNFYFQHGASLYETSIKVPLILKNSKIIPQNKRIRSRVQLTDLMPTILDILNIPVIDRIDGKSLLPLIEGKTDRSSDFIFAESIEEHFKGNKRVFFPGVKGKWRAMIVGDWKIIYIPHPENDIFELYNLEKDPKEEHNLIEKEKETAEMMKKKILDYLKQQSNEGDVDLDDLSDKSKKLLKKLGYIE